jgi:hypothetical protein
LVYEVRIGATTPGLGSDIKSSLQEMIALGATLLQDIKNVGSGLVVASVKDKDGNILGFRQNTQ